MGFNNYSTKINVHQTLGEIQKILVENGARKIQLEYDDKGQILELKFFISSNSGDLFVKLPANTEGVYSILHAQRKKGEIKIKIDHDQALRVAWRNIKEWTEAQMALIAAGQAKIEQVFLPYVLNKNGQTFFEIFEENQKLLIENGEEPKGGTH